MPRLRHAAALAASLGVLAAPALAQDDGGSDAPAAPAAPAEGSSMMSMGEDAGGADDGPGSIYVEAETGDWQVRCTRAEEGQDPCTLYQLLTDDEGNSVAEVSIFDLPQDQGEAVAGGTIITPLMTLLPAGVRISVDGGDVRQYPFTFCDQIGCFSRVGFTQAEVDTFRRGLEADLTVVPVQAPDETVDLTISLNGFTDGYQIVADRNDAQ